MQVGRGGGGGGGGESSYQIETFHDHTRLLRIANDLRDDALLAFVFSSQNLNVVAAQDVPFIAGET